MSRLTLNRPHGRDSLNLKARSSSYRPRIGIYEPGSRCPTSHSRYVTSILRGLDPEEFDVVLLARPDGPYSARPGVTLEQTIGETSDDGARPLAHGHRVPPGDRPTPRPDDARPGREIPRAAWRRLAPAPARLWAGFTRDCLRLARRFRELDLDLLHTNKTGCEESAVAARLAGIARTVGTFHVDTIFNLDRVRDTTAYHILEHASNRFIDCSIAVSEATRAYWTRRCRLRPNQVVTIHHGIDPNEFQRRRGSREARQRLGLPAEDALLIGGVGRLEQEKGFADLLEAVALLAPEFPTLHLILAGDGSQRSALLEQARGLGLADRVHILGFQADVTVVYEALDVFVLPSRCEALGYVLLEAMAMELPVVGTRVGGIPEGIRPGETGLLAAPSDSTSLATALRPLLETPELRRRMGAAGRDRIRSHFTEEKMVRRTVSLYREMLSTGPERKRSRPRWIGNRS